MVIHMDDLLQVHISTLVYYLHFVAEDILTKNVVDKSFQGLIHLAADDDAEIRTKVCCAFTKLIATRYYLLVPHMDDIIEVVEIRHNLVCATYQMSINSSYLVHTWL